MSIHNNLSVANIIASHFRNFLVFFFKDAVKFLLCMDYQHFKNKEDNTNEFARKCYYFKAFPSFLFPNRGHQSARLSWICSFGKCIIQWLVHAILNFLAEIYFWPQNYGLYSNGVFFNSHTWSHYFIFALYRWYLEILVLLFRNIKIVKNLSFLKFESKVWLCGNVEMWKCSYILVVSLLCTCRNCYQKNIVSR